MMIERLNGVLPRPRLYKFTPPIYLYRSVLIRFLKEVMEKWDPTFSYTVGPKEKDVRQLRVLDSGVAGNVHMVILRFGLSLITHNRCNETRAVHFRYCSS